MMENVENGKMYAVNRDREHAVTTLVTLENNRTGTNGSEAHGEKEKGHWQPGCCGCTRRQWAPRKQKRDGG